jgi:hypothetical protein
MVKQTLTTLVLAAGALLSAQALAEPADYNGTWSVQLLSESGSCDRSANYTIAVEDGRVRYLPSGNEARVSVSGQVGPDGNVSIGVRQGLGSADASGRLGAGSGSGTWKVSMLGCTGRWTAQRRTTTAKR